MTDRPHYGEICSYRHNHLCCKKRFWVIILVEQILIVYYVAAMHAEGRLLSCDQSVDRLVEILNANRFDSGAHIDYYDD